VRHAELYSLVNRRQRRQASAARSLRRRAGRLAFGCAAVAMLALVAAALLIGLAYVNLTSDLPSVQRVPGLLDPVSGPLLQPTRLYDRSGQVLLMSLENAGYQRRYLSIDPNQENHISPEMLRVSVALLEPDFWQSPGFAWRHAAELEPQTVAERLSLDLLLWQEPLGLRRAARMRLLAAQLVSTYGRAQVLEWYLNTAYFGHLAYGAESAARLYLGQPASQVNLSGAALLMAVHQAPALNPLDAPDAARARQAEALDTLEARGVITAQEHQRALSEGLTFAPPPPESALPAEAFSRLALDQLAARFGRQRVERGGLRVITTLDYNLQLELTCLVQAQLRRLSSPGSAQAEQPARLPDGSLCQSVRLLPSLSPADQQQAAGQSDLLANAVIMDPRSGEVLALLGDTSTSGERATFSAHAPGSLLTPVVAVAAFSRGFSPASLV
jgi:membrane peptidoglycan carboxypeptidase